MVKKILVRAPNWVGDGVMATPALTTLRSNFKEAEIIVLAKPAVAALLLHHPAIDRILVYEAPGRHTGPVGFLRLVTLLRRERFDLAILLQNAFEAALLSWLAGIPKRHGYDTDGRAFLLTSALSRKKAPQHQREAFSQVVPCKYQQSAIPTPENTPSLLLMEEEVKTVSVKLASLGIAKNDFLVGISPGTATGSAKRWLPERFAELADRLVEKYQAKILLLGGPNDRAVSEEVQSTMKREAILLAGDSPLREMMAVLSLCRLSISNDSGPMHIASALGIPYIALFGATIPAAAFPGGLTGRGIYHAVNCSPCKFSVCPVNHHCMTAISVEEVFTVAQELIAVSKKENV